MRSYSKIAAKIVVSVTTLVLFTACGHTGVKPENNFQTPEPIDTSAISADSDSSANFKAEEPQQLQEQQPVKKVAKKKSKKRLIAKGKNKKAKSAQQAPSPAAAAASATVTQQAPIENKEAQIGEMQIIDPGQLPLSVGSVETPAPPALPPIYEGLDGENNNALIAAVAAIALVVGAALVIRRRRTRTIIFNS